MISDTSGTAWGDAGKDDDVFGNYPGIAWFRITLAPNATGPRVLHFNGVGDNATVYLNGQKLATHEG